MKKTVEIEKLLQWAYLDELSKRKISSAEGIWDRLAQYGSLGGVNPDPGHGAAQRYPHFGLPHRDAELIEIAVGQLGRMAFDWRANFRLVANDLAALVAVNDVRMGFHSQSDRPTNAKISVSEDGRGVSARVDRQVQRDVLLINTVNVAALVVTHAIKATRPDWRTEQMRPVPTLAERSNLAKIIGKCKGKNLYTTGSYCPLRWAPSPIEVVLARADYLLWHQALRALAGTLRLTEHHALPPAAPATPWIETPPPTRVFRSQAIGTSRPLPLKPQRGRAGALLKKSRKNKETSAPLAKGALS